jgi:hypothetical protein
VVEENGLGPVGMLGFICGRHTGWIHVGIKRKTIKNNSNLLDKLLWDVCKFLERRGLEQFSIITYISINNLTITS